MIKNLIILNLILISITDIRYLKIPDKFIKFLLVLIILNNISKKAIFSSLYSFFLVSILMIIYSLFTKIGGGDVKLISVLSLYFELENIFIIFTLSTISAGLVGLILMLLGRAKLNTKIPLGPFIALISIIFLL